MGSIIITTTTIIDTYEHYPHQAHSPRPSHCLFLCCLIITIAAAITYNLILSHLVTCPNSESNHVTTSFSYPNGLFAKAQ